MTRSSTERVESPARTLDDGGHGLFRRTARLNIRPLAQLDPDIHRPGTRLPRPGTVSIAVVHPLRAALWAPAPHIDVQRHQAISRPN
jgi:hypothetical protein